VDVGGVGAKHGASFWIDFQAVSPAREALNPSASRKECARGVDL